jgi:pesticin/yersiniabactin receptor
MVACAFAALQTAPALAQGTSITVGPGGVVELPPLTVTSAGKRPQRLYEAAPTVASEVPGTTIAVDQPADTADANISVRSSAELRAAGVDKIADLERVFPGLVIRSRGNRAYASFTVRGMSSPDFYNPSVQVLIDGVPMSAASFTQDLVDVERVEFLRGPQGVLYGANAFGGVLNIITRQARENTAAASATVSTLRSGAQASATAVLMPHAMFVDVAVKREWDPGEIDSTLTGENNVDSASIFAGRTSLRYAPKGGPLDVAFTYAYDRARSYEEFYLRDQMLHERKYDLPIPRPFLDRTTHTASANWNYRMGSGFMLTGISAFQDVDLTRDIFGFQFPEAERAFSQEIRLAYSGAGPLTGVAGIYFRSSDFSRSVSYLADRNEIGTDTLAAFGDLTWHITRKFDVTGGVRFTHDRSIIDYALPAFLISVSDTADFYSTQPKVSIGYQLTDLTRIYALVSQGYKPGGFQHAIVNPANPADFAAYRPETAWNYEAGVRTSLFRRSLDLSAAIYIGG